MGEFNLPEPLPFNPRLSAAYYVNTLARFGLIVRMLNKYHTSPEASNIWNLCEEYAISIYGPLTNQVVSSINRSKSCKN
jgi:hypothetical protein